MAGPLTTLVNRTIGFRRRRHLFIVGCGHSGTSLLLALLGNHPKIHAISGESRAFLLSSRKRLKLFWQWSREMAENSAELIAEKTPKHVLCTSAIRGAFPNAVVIGIVRDPRDVVASLLKRKDSVDTAIGRWLGDNSELLKAKSEGRVSHVLRYEDLIENPEREIRAILDLIELDYAEGMLDPSSRPKRWYSEEVSHPGRYDAATHNQYRNWQINQPIFDGRGAWRSELSDEQAARVVQQTRLLARELGYPD
jgi:hypothetical protein